MYVRVRSFSVLFTLISPRVLKVVFPCFTFVCILTGKKPYECSVCRRRSNDASSRRRHEREHTEAKPYPCLYCSESFKRASQLKTHTSRKHFMVTQEFIVGASTAAGPNQEEYNVVEVSLPHENNGRPIVVKLPDLSTTSQTVKSMIWKLPFVLKLN